MGSTDADLSQIQLLRRALLVNYAVDSQLDAVGGNRGIPRPPLTTDAEIYRRVIKSLAFIPKQVLLAYYSLLTAVLGSQESVAQTAGRPWRVFEVNPNEVIIELPASIIAGNIETSAYRHGANGYARIASGPTDTFTTDFDLQPSSATTLVGKAIYVETSAGTWTAYTILAYSYNATTHVATVQVSASTLPAGGGNFYLGIPGDGTASYRGKYVATDGFASTYSTGGGPTDTILVSGDVTEATRPGMILSLFITSAFSPRVVLTTSYSVTTNITTIVLTTSTVPGGVISQPVLLAQEVADTVTTPPHDDRVYLTGNGLYEVVEYYLDLLVRTAGIVVRLEIV